MAPRKKKVKSIDEIMQDNRNVAAEKILTVAITTAQELTEKTERTTALAAKVIADANELAIKLKAINEEIAQKVVSNAAAEAIKNAGAQNAGDHDLIMDLKGDIKALTAVVATGHDQTTNQIKDVKDTNTRELKELRDGLTGKVLTLETTVGLLCTWQTEHKTKEENGNRLLKALIFLMALIVTMTVWHLTGFKI